jgi:hypothetical protein
MCLLAATIRNPPTYEYLMTLLRASTRIVHEDVTAWAADVAGPQRYRYEYRDSIRILALRAAIHVQ